ncbi:MAG: hypothetical protein WC600_06065 [Desulfobaccales bacterium]
MRTKEMVLEFVDQLRTGNEIEPQVILDFGAVHRLPAQVLGQQQGLHFQSGGVDRRGQTGRSATDDDQVVGGTGAGSLFEKLIAATLRTKVMDGAVAFGGDSILFPDLHPADGIPFHNFSPPDRSTRPNRAKTSAQERPSGYL